MPWTSEAREAARQRILKNKPWEKSTGPKTEAGKFVVSFNALKDGLRLSDPLLRQMARRAAKERLDRQSAERVRRVVVEWLRLYRETPPPQTLVDALDYCYFNSPARKLQCSRCKSRYITKKGFTGSFHTGKQRWQCEDCGKTFSL